MNTVKELNCNEVVELITDYLEHALLPQTQEQLEAHFANCPGCLTYLEQVKKTLAMLSYLAREEVFPETKQGLIEIFRTWKQGSILHEQDSV